MLKSEKGQATVELAITITLLIIILFGIIDFGRLFHVYLTLEHASREGARIASVGATDLQITQRARESAPALIPENVTVSITPTQESRTRGVYTTVQLTYPVSFSTPVFQNILPNPFEVKVKTVMRVE